MKLPALVIALLAQLLSGPAAAERWFADPQRSQIRFRGEMQSGPVEGAFSKYWVDMVFNPDQLDGAYLKANIQTAPVTTLDITRTEDGRFLARGKLNLRGAVGDATLRFSLDRDQVYDAARLIGTAKIEQLDFGLGQDAVLDASIVGNTIKIEVDLYVRPTLE